ncbi:hypothetical protein RsoM2USA_190 [Ralstonia phage RsoM2USA]|nr:hypothetical protein RsoM2USA_190 [Ralstonia phage RsoM2USA]
MSHTSLEKDLDEFIISVSDMYEKTKPDRIKALQPVVQDMMLKISTAMKRSQTSITYQYSHGSNSMSVPSMNSEQARLLTRLLTAKGYIVKDTSYHGDQRDPGYNQLTISWSMQ